MAPLWAANAEGIPDVIVVETIDRAFVTARTRWPTAVGWRCLGFQDDNDLEVCIPDRRKLEERVVRGTWKAKVST